MSRVELYPAVRTGCEERADFEVEFEGSLGFSAEFNGLFQHIETLAAYTDNFNTYIQPELL
jgi:hypothetical protein